MLASPLAAMKPSRNPESSGASNSGTDWIELVRHHVSNLQFGVVQITVHGGRVVQVDRTERLRFTAEKPPVQSAEKP